MTYRAVLALAFAAAPIALPVALTAQPGVPGAPDAKRVVAGAYKVDSDHTQVLFTINHQGFSEYTGQFTQPKGTLMLDPAKPAAAKVEIVFPMDRLMTSVPLLDTHMKGPDYFDVAKFPEGRFVSTKVTPRGTGATIVGDLTLKGITKPITLQARFFGAGTNRFNKKTDIGFSATATIKRSDYGIVADLPGVSDMVRLTINATFESQ